MKKNNLMKKGKSLKSNSKFSWEKHGSFVSLGIIIVILVIIIGVWYGTKQHKKGRKFVDVGARARIGDVKTDLNFEFFDSDINSDVPTFVMFYAPWCGHCKTAKPEFDNLKNMKDLRNSNGEQVKCLLINAEENKDLATKYDIKGFPTIKLIKGNLITEYNGARTTESMANFIKNN